MQGAHPPCRQESGPRDLRGLLPDLHPLRSLQTGCPSAAVVLDRTPPLLWTFVPAAQKQVLFGHRFF